MASPRRGEDERAGEPLLAVTVSVNSADDTSESSAARGYGGGASDTGADAAAKPRPKGRVMSIDVARGFVMFQMIMVDNQGTFDAVTWFFRESTWSGLTPADTVFASFIFVVGLAIDLALGSRPPTRATYTKVMLRFVKMFLIGAALNLFAANFHFDTFGIMGVLQRIAICYIIAAMSYLALPLWAQRVVPSVCLGIYCGVMYIWHVPGCGAGVITPTCNGGAYVDRAVWGRHMHGPNMSEGLISTLTAVVTVFLGLEFGRVLRRHKAVSERKELFLEWTWRTVVCFALGGILAIWTPVNKKVWSPSFVCVVAGVSGLTLCVFLLLVDLWPAVTEELSRLGAGKPPRTGDVSPRSQSWLEFAGTIVAFWLCQPLQWLGRNPLAVFVGMVALEIVGLDTVTLSDGTSLWTSSFNHTFGALLKDQAAASSMYAAVHLILWTAIAWALNRRKLYITL